MIISMFKTLLMEDIYMSVNNFITFEGGEGAGKTTVIHHIKQRLEELGYNVITTREPGGVELAEKIRDVILGHNINMDNRTEAILFAASRREHLVKKVKPFLDEGYIVLCDRFIDSSLAYQGYARGIGIDEVLTLNSFSIEDCMPQLTLWLDIDSQIGLNRIKSNEREMNRLDHEAIHFHEMVRKGYDIIYQQFPERIKKIDAAQTVEAVVTDCMSNIIKVINK